MYKILNLIVALFFITNAYSIIPNYVTVTNLSDDGSMGSLRWAIISANADFNINQIDFDSALTGTIILTSNLPNITSSMSINGPGVSNLIISGNQQYNMFNVLSGAVLTVSGLTFSDNKNSNGSIFRADNNYSSVVASSITVTANNNSFAFYTNNHSSISISNSNFTSNSGQLFGSDYGSTPNTTSNVETDYTNRITVTGSTFDANTGILFSTERYVKIDNCVFSNNTSQIGSFRGVNRYQVLNSTFTNNTGWTLFSFSSWIGDTPSWGESTLGTNNTLFEGNTFTGNTGTVINPGWNSKYYSKTTISDNIFINNGTSYSGTPSVVSNNTLDNFISSVTHSVLENTLTVTMDRPVFNSNTGSGSIEVSDFELSLSGGNAELISTTPSSFNVSGNVYTLGILLSGEISGAELITVKPLINSIFDSSFNVAGVSQQNSTINLKFLDDDADGVSNFLDLCPNTLSGVRVYPNNGCEDTTYPFITHYDYGTTLNYPNNFVSAPDRTLYFTSYDSNWKLSINKLTPEKIISNLYSPINGYIQNLTTDALGNLFYSYYDNDSGENQISKISEDGTISLLVSSIDGHYQNLTADALGNLYVIHYLNSNNSRAIEKISIDGTVTVLDSESDGYFQNLIIDTSGNVYFIHENYSLNTKKIIKIATDGTISDLYTAVGYIDYMKVDSLGNIYFVNYNTTTNSNDLKKITSSGTVSNLEVLSSGSFQGIAVDAMNNLLYVVYDYNTGKSLVNSISSEGVIISYGEFKGNQLFSDSIGMIYFDDNGNKKIMTTKSAKPTPTLSDFDAIAKYFFDGSFQVEAPKSDSTGAFSYVSSNTDVATIDGSEVTIVGVGVTTITAIQASDVKYP